jgi:arylsulfatase A-like enzyme/Flp pilus assembly protein TadD
MGLIGCNRAAPRWNVLLVTFDTTRADRLGCYGNSRIETPTLDRLAADGIRFSQAMSAVPITAPSHSTILTGAYPPAHGVRDNGLFVLSPDRLTLAEMLHDAGYATAAAVGSFPVTSQFGLDQGFDLFDDHLTGLSEDYLGRRTLPKDRLFFDERRAAQVNEAVIPWITDHADDPFFVWVHYFDPHQPFEPPPPYDQLYADDLYNGEIAYADSRLGYLFDHLRRIGALDRTLIVMAADHGEGLGEHNELTHAVLAYGATVHVPLIIRPPAGVAPAGTVVDTRVGTVDIVPTILDLLGLDPPASVQGRSLVPTWQTRDAPPPHPLQYAENLSPSLTHGWGELRVLFDGDLKYIHGPRPELYDLANDPGELHDLSADRPEDVGRLQRELSDLLKQISVDGASTAIDLNAEDRARLEALGYLHSSASPSAPISEVLHDGGIPPQDRVGDLNDLSAAKHLLFSGRLNEAMTYTERLMRDDPHSPLYLELHATALMNLGRLDEALEVVERLRAVGEVSEPLVLQLAARQFEAGDTGAAVELLHQHLETHPTAPGQWLLATLLARRGASDDSIAALYKALEINPHFAPARVSLAVDLATAGDTATAEGHFLEALEDSPYDPRALYNYGTFVLHEGRLDDAAAIFERTIALAPKYLKAHLALVATHLAADRRIDAEGAFEALQRLAPRSDEAAAAAEMLASP